MKSVEFSKNQFDVTELWVFTYTGYIERRDLIRIILAMVLSVK